MSKRIQKVLYWHMGKNVLCVDFHTIPCKNVGDKNGMGLYLQCKTCRAIPYRPDSERISVEEIEKFLKEYLHFGRAIRKVKNALNNPPTATGLIAFQEHKYRMGKMIHELARAIHKRIYGK